MSKDSYYNTLQNVFDNAGNKIILMGDINGRVGKDNKYRDRKIYAKGMGNLKKQWR